MLQVLKRIVYSNCTISLMEFKEDLITDFDIELKILLGGANSQIF